MDGSDVSGRAEPASGRGLGPGLWEFPNPMPGNLKLTLAVDREGLLVGGYIRRPEQTDREVREIMSEMIPGPGDGPDLHVIE